jgi:hypothetical protein
MGALVHCGPKTRLCMTFAKSLKMRNKQNRITTFLNTIQPREEGCLFALFVLAFACQGKGNWV